VCVPACAGGGGGLLQICVAEVEEVVEAGELAPEEIHLPGVYVQHVLLGTGYEKRIERRTEQGGAAFTVDGMRERVSGRCDPRWSPIHAAVLTGVWLQPYAAVHLSRNHLR
jgi:hypothetical protein